MSTKQNVACIANVIQNAPYEFDSILIYYNEFINSITTKVRTVEIMNAKRFLKNFSRLSIYEAEEPAMEFSKYYYYELYVASRITRHLLPRPPPECRL